MSRAAHNVQGYWGEQLDLIQRLPAAVETREPESVHDLRAAGRRLKATIRAFRPLLRPNLARRLLIELDWFNSELGKARDAEVVREHLAELLSGHPEAQPLLDELAAQQELSRLEAVEMLGSERVAYLLGQIEDLVVRPWQRATRRKGKGPTRRQILNRADWTEQRVAKAWPESDDQVATNSVGLHVVRRRAKAARYAFESIGDAYSRAGDKVKYYSGLSELLGIVQDSVVVERVLAAHPGEPARIALEEQRRRSAVAEEQVTSYRSRVVSR